MVKERELLEAIYASDFGKRICLACGGRLGEGLRHAPPPQRVNNQPFTVSAEVIKDRTATKDTK